MKRLGLALVLAVAAVPLGWQMLRPPAMDPDDARQVARGRAVYGEHCASCHGQTLEGQPDWRVRKPTGELPAPPHDPSGHTWHHADEQLFAIVRDGIAPFAPPGYRTDMPAFRQVLVDSDIRAVLTYIKSTWPEEIRERQAAANRR